MIVVSQASRRLRLRWRCIASGSRRWTVRQLEILSTFRILWSPKLGPLGEVATSALNQLLYIGVRLHELEAVAKGVSVANQGANRDGAVRKLELELHDLVEGDLDFQDGGDSGFTDVNGATAEQAALARVDFDGDVKFRAWAATFLVKPLTRVGYKLIFSFQLRLLERPACMFPLGPDCPSARELGM